MSKGTIDTDGIANANVICRKIKKGNGQNLILSDFSTFRIYVNVQAVRKGESISIHLQFDEIITEKNYDKFIKCTAELIAKYFKQNNLYAAQFSGRGEHARKFILHMLAKGIKIYI